MASRLPTDASIRRLVCLALTAVTSMAVPQFAAQQRDSPAQQAQPRRIPVGTSSISGVVISAETGKPLRNVQVSLSGTAGSQDPEGRATGAASAPSSGQAGPRGSGGGAVGSGVVGGSAGASDPRAGGPGYPTLGISRTTTTGDQGQFAFAKLAAGRYTINISRDTYLQWISNQKAPGGRGKPYTLADGEHLGLTVPLVRGGVIAGRVFDEEGEPLRNVQVSVYRFNLSNGVKRLQQSNSVQTDDRGAYRLINLQPGDYLVAAVPRNQGVIVSETVAADRALVEGAIASAPVQAGAMPGFPAFVTLPPPQSQSGPTRTLVPGFIPVFFPGTTTPTAATTIHIAGGDSHESFDIPLQFVRATVVQGLIAGARPQGSQLMVSLTNTDPGGVTTSMSTGVSAEDGKFTLANIPPGRYRLMAQTNPNSANVFIRDGGVVNAAPAAPAKPDDTVWAAQDLNVDGQETIDVTLVLQPARTISGTVVYDMARATATPPPVSVSLTNWPGSNNVMYGPVPQVQADANGRFTLTGVIAGTYSLRGTSTMRSAMLGDRDLLDFPFEFRGDQDVSGIVITVSDKRTDLGGTVTDAAGHPLVEYSVVVAPAESTLWTPGSRRIQITRTGPFGRYRMQQLPPGRYVVGVVADLDDGMQFDPEFLKSLAAAGRVVTLADDAPVKQDFRAAAAP